MTGDYSTYNLILKRFLNSLRGAILRKAFTLVETLCVLGIIAIVAAISFPVFAAVRRSSKKAVSMSNLRQVYLQTEMYRSDHDGDGRWGSTYAMGLPPSSVLCSVQNLK